MKMPIVRQAAQWRLRNLLLKHAGVVVGCPHRAVCCVSTVVHSTSMQLHHACEEGTTMHCACQALISIQQSLNVACTTITPSAVEWVPFLLLVEDVE
jgi:hypothetical protein